MKLAQITDMIAIVEHGSLRAAARRLGVPQPALTRSVRALEKELGVTLFERETRGMTLTSSGELFHRRAHVIVSELRRAREELAQDRGDDTGEIVAAMSIMPHLGMLPRALPVFRKRYPRVRLRLIEGLFPHVESRLRNGSIDFYLGAGPQTAPAPGLKVERLFENTRAVVARKGHPLAAARSLRQLVDAEWAVTSINYNAEDDLRGLFAGHKLAPPRVTLQASSTLSLMIGLLHSDLLALLPTQWNEFDLTRDALVRVPIREQLEAPVAVLIRRPDLPLTPAAQFFCDVMGRYAPKASPIRPPLRVQPRRA
jgi:DNA-binding transcriptional LysR family regulator